LHGIHHRLSLGEVKAPGDEGAQCELATLGRAGTRARGESEHLAHACPTAVAMQLDNILAGVRARRAHVGQQHLVH
jgi:hypothetical protein